MVDKWLTADVTVVTHPCIL